jgi:hypothetical protein
VEDEEEYNQCDEVPFFVNTRRINIVETKISYNNVIPYACTDGEGKLLIYSSSLHILYVSFSVTWILCHQRTMSSFIFINVQYVFFYY